MKKIIAGFACCGFVLCGCAGLNMNVQRPAGCENSIIYSVEKNPDLINTVALVGLNESLIKFPQAKPYVKKFLDTALKALDDDQLTYLDFVTIINDNVKWINEYFGNRLVIYTSLFSAFDSPLPITDCDKNLLKKHFTNLLMTTK